MVFCLSTATGNFRLVLVERGLERGNVFFGGGLGGVDADEGDAFVGELTVPLAVPGIIVLAVGATEREKVDDDDLAAERFHRQRRRVEPGRGVCEFRGREFWGECRTGGDFG